MIDDDVRQLQRQIDDLRTIANKAYRYEIPGKVTTYTPAWTCATNPPAIGAGTITGQYVVRAGFCLCQIFVSFAGDSTYGTGAFRFSLPFTVSASAVTNTLGIAHLRDAGTNNYDRLVVLAPSDTYVTNFIGLDNATNLNSIDATTPFTWATGDNITIQIEYRI